MKPLQNDMQPLSATARLQRCLAAIERWNGAVNAIITVDLDGAMHAAQAADEAAAQGRTLGLMHGVPMVLKDNIDTAGLRTTYGSGFFHDHVPTDDAFVVKRLRQAGAVIVGKANLQEFAFGIRSTNPVVGQCRNPWDLARIPGGSSGGSAVALATGMADLSLGTDTAASIRIPAALTGVCGLRPTVGRVSNAGSFPLSHSQDVVGPMARSVEDLALAFAVIAGYHPADPGSEDRDLPNFLPRLRDGIKGIRIGRPRNYYFDELDDEVRTALDAAAETLAALGADVVDVDIEGVHEVADSATVILLCDACDVHSDRIGKDGPEWSAQTLERMRRGLAYSGVDYARAMRHRARWIQTLGGIFERVDLLLTPTSPILAPAIDDSRSLFALSRALSRNTIPGSFGRLPGLSIPCGASRAGLPIGLQLESARWNEPLLLRAGYTFQAVTEWHNRVPELAAATVAGANGHP